ncbi:DUF4299 family protein [Dietzia sp.]|uniref:DUF4299 family protein n=1 Tax=Dietzia sp. TaxID=1871616 RepID=UPI002FD9FAE3
MSITFTVAPPGRRHRPLRLAEAMRLGPTGLRPYFQPEENGGSEELERYAGRKTDEIISRLGISPYSGRGFEFTYQQGAYTVRVLTPSAPNDWRIALDFLSALARHFGASVVAENGDNFTAETITSFDYSGDIRAGLMAFLRSLESGNPAILVQGVNVDVSLNREILDHIFRSDSPANAFGDFVGPPQHTDAHFASQMAARAPDGSIQGLYTLTEGVDTVLPHSPTLPPHIRQQVGQESPVDWELALVGIDGPDDDPESFSSLGAVDFAAAFRALPPRKVSRFDADRIYIRGLNRADIRALLDSGRGA